MRFSLSFIKQFIDLEISAEELAGILTMAGMEVEALEKREDDWVFDIEVTTNRYDWLSIIGIAREVSACLGKKFELKFPEIIKEPVIQKRKIIIENSVDCLFYAARAIEGVEPVRSPLWLEKLITNCGISTVNNVVDITNFCMLKWGNPLHAFDEDKIEGNIYVRRAKDEELFIGIDDKPRELNKQNLVIADDKKIIALAGVMGAKNTEVDAGTKNVFLEAAVFSPGIVRNSRRSVGLDTESSYRFERRVSSKHLEFALAEAEDMIEKLTQGKPGGYAQAGQESRETESEIVVNLTDLNKYLGVDIPGEKVEGILSNLGFGLAVSNDRISVTVPAFRFDIEKNVDIYEEIARIFGYDKISSKIPFLAVQLDKELAVDERSKLYTFKNEIRTFVASLGAREIITYSIEEETESKSLGEENFIRILNPLKTQENIMRPSLLSGMIKSARYNLNRNQKNLRFFEIADIYSRKNENFTETSMLSLGVSGEKIKGVFYLKGIVEKILNYLNIDSIFKEQSFLNFKNSLTIIAGGRNIGFLGKLDTRIRKDFALKEELFYAQLNVCSLNELRREKVFSSFSPYPEVFRDISYALRKDKKFSEVREIILDKAGEYLQDMRIVDEYKGKDIPHDYSAFTLRIFYQSKERTLTCDGVDVFNNAIRQALSCQEGIILR